MRTPNRFALLLASCAFMFGIGLTSAGSAAVCCSACIKCDTPSGFCDDLCHGWDEDCDTQC